MSKGEHPYLIDGKPVDRQTWIKHAQESERKLIEELRTRDEELRRLQEKRNELVHNVSTSGVSALLQSPKVDSIWLQSWLQSELPDMFTQSQLDALTIFEARKEKRENSWIARLRKGFGWLIGGIILTLLSILMAWGLGLIGFR